MTSEGADEEEDAAESVVGVAVAEVEEGLVAVEEEHLLAMGPSDDDSKLNFDNPEEFPSLE